MNVTKVEDNYAIFVTFSRIEEPLKKSWFFNIPTYLKNNEKLEEVCNLFTTSDPPKYSNSNSPYLCFCLLKGDKKTISLVQTIFSNNKNVFLSPCNKRKQRFGELKLEYFGGSDVVNKLIKANFLFCFVFCKIYGANFAHSFVDFHPSEYLVA